MVSLSDYLLTLFRRKIRQSLDKWFYKWSSNNFSKFPHLKFKMNSENLNRNSLQDIFNGEFFMKFWTIFQRFPEISLEIDIVEGLKNNKLLKLSKSLLWIRGLKKLLHLCHFYWSLKNKLNEFPWRDKILQSFGEFWIFIYNRISYK